MVEIFPEPKQDVDIMGADWKEGVRKGGDFMDFALLFFLVKNKMISLLKFIVFERCQ